MSFFTVWAEFKSSDLSVSVRAFSEDFLSAKYRHARFFRHFVCAVIIQQSAVALPERIKPVKAEIT